MIKSYKCNRVHDLLLKDKAPKPRITVVGPRTHKRPRFAFRICYNWALGGPWKTISWGPEMEGLLASWDLHHCEALPNFFSILNRCICCCCCMHCFYWIYSLDIGLLVSTADFGGHSEQNLGGQVQSLACHSEPLFIDCPLLFLNFHLPLVTCQLLQLPCACHCSTSVPTPQWSGSLCLECLFLHHYPLLYLPSSYSFIKTILNATSSRKPSQITQLECFYSSLPCAPK